MATSTDLRSAIEEVQQSLPAEQQGDAEGQPLAAEGDWMQRLERRVGRCPGG